MHETRVNGGNPFAELHSSRDLLLRGEDLLEPAAGAEPPEESAAEPQLPTSGDAELWQQLAEIVREMAQIDKTELGKKSGELDIKKEKLNERSPWVSRDVGSVSLGPRPRPLEVVVDGRFEGRILLRNVQLYRLVLVLLVLRDLDQGYVQLGSGTTRGNGWVRAAIRRLVIEARSGKTPDGGSCGGGVPAPGRRPLGERARRPEAGIRER